MPRRYSLVKPVHAQRLQIAKNLQDLSRPIGSPREHQQDETHAKGSRNENTKNDRGKTRRDRVRNKDIRKQCGKQDIVRWGTKRKRQWYNHFRRLDEP